MNNRILNAYLKKCLKQKVCMGINFQSRKKKTGTS